MSPERPEIGSLVWIDLTVSDAEAVRDFYTAVVGWQAEDVDMDGYADFNMNAPGSGATVTGVCHARGINAELPAAWLPYFVVADLDTSTARCVELGGEVVVADRALGDGRFCVVRDPAGALAALYEM